MTLFIVWFKFSWLSTHPGATNPPTIAVPCVCVSPERFENMPGCVIHVARLHTKHTLLFLPPPQVLTSKSCSEEGLEDATALLLHLSHGPPPARDQVLRLLLQGAATLGSTVATHIAALLGDLKAYNASHPPVAIVEEEHQPHLSEKAKKGLLQDR